MGSLLVFGLTTLTLLMPWRTRLANRGDRVMGHILVLVMLAAGPLLVIDQSQSEFIASAMLEILCLASPSVALACSCFLMYDCLQRECSPELFFSEPVPMLVVRGVPLEPPLQVSKTGGQAL